VPAGTGCRDLCWPSGLGYFSQTSAASQLQVVSWQWSLGDGLHLLSCRSAAPPAVSALLRINAEHTEGIRANRSSLHTAPQLNSDLRFSRLARRENIRSLHFENQKANHNI
uniref:Uncharacterized protein n=1 Tax=Electrophorus electricus TaxID=8005 RepID=A0A4W4ELD1_ELEEL